MKYNLLFLVSLVLLLLTFENVNAQEIYMESNRVVKGYSDSGVKFSSIEQNNKFINVEIEVNGKVFSADIPPAGMGYIFVKGINLNDGKEAILDETDKTILKSFDKFLKDNIVDDNLAAKRLKRFVQFLAFFHPANEKFVNYDELTDVEKQGIDLLKKNEEPYKSICDLVDVASLYGIYLIPPFYVAEGYDCGENATRSEISGTDLDGSYECTEWHEVGGSDCVGRCGPGCSDVFPHPQNAYTHECFAHDLCARATGKWFGPCSLNLVLAEDGFFNAPNCSEDISESTEVEIFCSRFKENDDYYVQAYIVDTDHIIESANMSGDYISGTVQFTYNLYSRHPGEWWTNPNVFISEGAEPNFPLNYTVNINFKDGTMQYVSKSVNEWVWAE